MVNSTETPENPSAFPNTGNSNWNLKPERGMDLRDWFAGQVIGVVIREIQSGRIGDHPTAGGGPAGFAATSYDIADAMMAARTTGGAL